MRFASIGSLLCLALGMCAPAGASVIYSYGTDATSYSGAAGSVVPINIYLLETVTGSSSPLIAASGGLTSAGAAVNVVSTTGGTAASFGAANSQFVASPSFGNPASAPNSLFYNQGTGAQANNLEFLNLITNAQSGINPTNGKILLGTLDAVIGTGTTTYSLTSLHNDTINGSNSNLGQSDHNTATAQPAPFGTDLDVTQPGLFTGADDTPGSTFTVSSTASPVPEPASLAVFAVGAMGLLIRRRRAM